MQDLTLVPTGCLFLFLYLMDDERAVVQCIKSLFQLFTGVHHDGTAPGYRLMKGFGCQQYKTGTPVTGTDYHRVVDFRIRVGGTK